MRVVKTGIKVCHLWSVLGRFIHQPVSLHSHNYTSILLSFPCRLVDKARTYKAKDLSSKAKAKDLSLKAKAKAKDFAVKAKVEVEDLACKAKAKDFPSVHQNMVK